MTTATDFAELMRLARVHVSDRVPDQSRQSLPIPTRLGNDLRIAFLFAPAQILPGVNRLAPPHFVAWLHPVSGALVELRPVTPKSFQQTHGADEMIGEFRLPPDTTAEDYLAQRRQMFDLYPSLVAAWSGNLPPENVGLQAPAREFLRLFGILSEPPLIAYYHALGSRFFDWVRKAVKA